MSKVRKLCVAIPNLGSIKVQTVQCLMGSLFYTAGELGCGLHLFMPYGCLIDENRNHAAKEALETGSSHLMFIDSDMVFPDNGIVTLASMDKQVIGSNYNLRDGTRRSTVKILGGDGNMCEVSGDHIPKQLFKAYAVATGFMLIRTEVFTRIPKPWFFNEYNPEKDDITGEDVNFCKKLRANGIDVWCDPTIELGHIGDYQY